MQWVSDPARTNDELFTVEILLEGVRAIKWPCNRVDNSFAGRRERARERKLNPAHRPALHPDELRELIGRRDTIKLFSGAYGEDRPLRNLEALSFFPAIDSLSVQSSDVTDFTPLSSLKAVKYLSIAEYGDLYGYHPICLAECGDMPVLERLHLALRHPWPDLRAISAWKTLLDMRLNTNVLALEGMEPFPAARVVHLKNWPSERVALRNLQALPLMPATRELTIETAASLEGIERYPSVVNLEIAGPFRDLTPLASMNKITGLTLCGERFLDLRPLTRMASLREIKFVREWPLDVSSLADCPQLRRVEFERCAMMRTEVAALNAGLLPEALDFVAETPRPLAPLKFYRVKTDATQFFADRDRRLHAEREAFYDGDAVFRKAEERVFCDAMQAKFDRLLGCGWGLFQTPFVKVKRYQDTPRLVELVEIVRQFSARSRFPQHVTLVVEPHGDMSEEMKEIRARHEQANEPDRDYLIKYLEVDSVLEENAEERRHREERYEVLRREHLLRLRGEEAVELAYLAKDAPMPDETEPEREEPLSPGGDEGEGGVAIAPPPPPPPSGESNLSDNLMFYLEIHEDAVTCPSHWADRAQYTLGVPLERWTQADANQLLDGET